MVPGIRSSFLNVRERRRHSYIMMELVCGNLPWSGERDRACIGRMKREMLEDARRCAYSTLMRICAYSTLISRP